MKNLAEQTAKATDEIRGQITSMQTVTTSAVGAIRSIGSTIGQINDVTTAIAAAVEQQGAATREIARNIQHAAGGTSEVSNNIVGVSQASSRSRRCRERGFERIRLSSAAKPRRCARKSIPSCSISGPLDQNRPHLAQPCPPDMAAFRPAPAFRLTLLRARDPC